MAAQLPSVSGSDRSESSPRPVATAAALAVAHIGILAVAVPGTASAPVTPGVGRTASVIVQARPAHLEEAARAVHAPGGTVGRPLPIVDGFEARVSRRALPALQSSPWLRAVTANARARFEEFTYDATTSLSTSPRRRAPRPAGRRATWATASAWPSSTPASRP